MSTYPQARFLLSAAHARQFPPDLGAEVAVAGRSKVRRPGVQEPAHVPFVHTNGHAAADCQSPADVQVCGTLPLHPVCPGCGDHIGHQLG